MTTASSLRGLPSVAGVCAAAVLLSASVGEAKSTRDALVIPPGQEELLGTMVGRGSTPLGGCQFGSASTEKSFVRVRYRCEGARDVSVELRHADADGDALVRTSQFAIVATDGEVPSSLVAALEGNIRASESKWQWVKSRTAVREFPEMGGIEMPNAPDDDLTEAERALKEEAMKLYAEEKYPAALSKYIELARSNPRYGTLGMVVASLASTRPDAARVQALTTAADKYPDDSLAQFLAGVGAHYAAHQAAQSFEEKADLYRVALEYLDRLGDAYDFEPRVHIYRAISHFRLGNQAEAERIIEHAVELAVDDPDVYYCRAEIHQRVNVSKAIADLETYMEMSERLQQQGAIVTEKKEKQVRRMHRHLKAIAEGRADHEEIFDPIDRPEGGEIPDEFAQVVVLAGALAFVSAIGITLLRRRRGPRS